MIIERIKHATEEDLQIIISKTNHERFSVALRDTDAKLNLPTVTIFKTEETAKHYAEQLAGYLD